MVWVADRRSEQIYQQANEDDLYEWHNQRLAPRAKSALDLTEHRETSHFRSEPIHTLFTSPRMLYSQNTTLTVMYLCLLLRLTDSGGGEREANS